MISVTMVSRSRHLPLLLIAFALPACRGVSATSVPAQDSSTDGSPNDVTSGDEAVGDSTTSDALDTGEAEASSICVEDCWVPISPSGIHPRADAAAIWLDDRVLIAGGWFAQGFQRFCADDCAQYVPEIDKWTAVSGGVCNGTDRTRGIWTGQAALVPAGGALHAFTPASGHWDKYQPPDDVFLENSIIWTGSIALLWAGANTPSCGVSFDPSTKAFSPMSPPDPSLCRRGQSVVWAGDRMIVWGGYLADATDRGAAYDPTARVWTPISSSGAPAPRSDAPAVWTGKQVLVWGGEKWDSASGTTSGFRYDGGLYDVASDTWRPVAPPPSATGDSTNAVWADDRLMVWSGVGGWIYDPDTDEWTAMSTVGAPSTGLGAAIVWTGSELMVWGGGYPYATPEMPAARYRPPPKGK